MPFCGTNYQHESETAEARQAAETRRMSILQTVIQHAGLADAPRQVQKETIMLTIYRRHIKACEHKHEGRRYRRCRCPIWVDGFLGDTEIRESLSLRDWQKAQEKIREWESEGVPTAEVKETSMEVACAAFESDAKARGLQEPTLKKYRVLFRQLRSFADNQGLYFIRQCDLEMLRKFRESWPGSGISALKKLERLRAFLRFARQSGWIEEDPTRHLKNPKIKISPTMPYTQEQMLSILAACHDLTVRQSAGEMTSRLRAFVLLLRYGGMRIGDTATCPIERLNGDRLLIYTQKTGVPVNAKLPRFVVDALNNIPTTSSRYFFWTGEGNKDTVAGNWRRSLRRVFALAGIKDGHPHRFRDTFAVELLLAGVPIERVSILLGHSSIRVTEKHYSPWIRARQEQLEADLERSWINDPVILAQTKGTPEVHGKQEAVN